MRTEHEMLDLVRAKLGRRRRRRRTVVASAGGGAAAMFVAVVLLAGGAGRPGAVDDVETGPGPGGTATSTITDPDPEERPAESSSTVTTIAPPTTASDAGAGASDAGSGGGGGDGPSGGDPGGGPSGGSSGGEPGGGSSAGSSSTGAGGSGAGSTTTTTSTTLPPGAGRPHTQEQTVVGTDGELTITVTSESDPSLPGEIFLRVVVDDPTGTLVEDGKRYGATVVYHQTDRLSHELTPRPPPCPQERPYTVEPSHYEETLQVTIAPGTSTDIAFVATTMRCRPEQADATLEMTITAS